ncbi:hypothetical protein [Rhizobium leucaenae]|uniref:Trypsin-like peptidase domain-containing protein n=1 Tax=Rhizobium leucaenae TaxID=29450 RepID=A0A7W7ENF1_9HYPH|nr:hypothetical protein [Rhizobium leucaenae]MBB4571544.1 hypothetical protein [Rhizobium leucaenae]
MTEEQWNALSGLVADLMKVHTRPFVTPIVHEELDKPPRIGTGTYLDFGEGRKRAVGVLTCEHVTRDQPLAHKPLGTQSLLPLTGVGKAAPDPIDASVFFVDQAGWQTQAHEAELLPLSRLAEAHKPARDELLFFRGVAGENVYIGFGGFDGILTGYCSQEKRDTGDDRIFEVFWEPDKTKIASGTDPVVRDRVKFDNAEGFSGSLVWNTRFVELGCDITAWSPDDAVVTGLLRRWDPKTRTLLALRAEHLVAWLLGS